MAFFAISCILMYIPFFSLSLCRCVSYSELLRLWYHFVRHFSGFFFHHCFFLMRSKHDSLETSNKKIVSYYKNGCGAFNKRKLTEICKELRRIVENQHKM